MIGKIDKALVYTNIYLWYFVKMRDICMCSENWPFCRNLERIGVILQEKMYWVQTNFDHHMLLCSVYFLLCPSEVSIIQDWIIPRWCWHGQYYYDFNLWWNGTINRRCVNNNIHRSCCDLYSFWNVNNLYQVWYCDLWSNLALLWC